MDGNLVVVAIASNINEAPSANGYTGVREGFNGGAKGCFEYYHVWKTGDSTSPIFSRATPGSDAYVSVALSGVATSRFIDTATGTSSEFGTLVNYPAITTHHDNDMDVYVGCADGDTIFSSPSLSSIVVQEDNALSSVAISTYVQPTRGVLGSQSLLTDTSLVNGSAVIALIAAPAP